MKRSGRSRSRLLVVAPLLFGACTLLTPTPDPSRFFVLTPIVPASGTSSSVFAASVGVGPVTFPPYLDRSEMVTRVSANEVRRATFDYWAGSLSDQFKTMLAQNLQTLLGGGPIHAHPWYAATAPDLVVEIDVRSFEPAIDGQAHLGARWRIRKGADPKVLSGGDFDHSRALTGQTPEQAAAGLSELLGEFSSEIAEKLRTLGKAR